MEFVCFRGSTGKGGEELQLVEASCLTAGRKRQVLVVVVKERKEGNVPLLPPRLPFVRSASHERSCRSEEPC